MSEIPTAFPAWSFGHRNGEPSRRSQRASECWPFTFRDDLQNPPNILRVIERPLPGIACADFQAIKHSRFPPTSSTEPGRDWLVESKVVIANLPPKQSVVPIEPSQVCDPIFKTRALGYLRKRRGNIHVRRNPQGG
jgi:hypothetical protein